MDTLQFLGNFEDLNELRKYKKQICAQYPDQNIVVYDYRYKYPIIHSINNNKSRMAFCRLAQGDIPTTQMLGKNNVSMEYVDAIRWSKTVHITDDPVLQNVDISFMCCKYPTLWVKEAVELGYSINSISAKISWQDRIDKSQHLIKGLGLNAKSFRVLMKCPNWFSLWSFKFLLSLGYSTQFIENHMPDIADITFDEVYDRECVDYIFSNTIFNYNSRFQSCWYKDYVKVRNQLPTHVKRNWPKCPNLTKHNSDKWHSLIMVEFNKQRAQIELLKSQQKQSQYFEEVYPKVKEFEFADEIYQVTAPEMVTSLLEEGRILHHCVGSYIDSVAAGKEYILYLRKVAEPNTPFFTINLLPDGKVRQIHGLCNCNVPKELKQFIDKWAKQFELNVKSCNGVYWHF